MERGRSSRKAFGNWANDKAGVPPEGRRSPPGMPTEMRGAAERGISRETVAERPAFGVAVCIGLDYRDFDREFYGDSRVEELFGPLHDVDTMKRLIERGENAQRVAVRRLKNSDATRDEVVQSITWAALGKDGEPGLIAGDLFVLSFSGHGVSLAEAGGDEAHDQAWCLFDNLLLDDELSQLWLLFAPGVRIVVVSDSCFSGSMLRDVSPEFLERLRNEPALARKLEGAKPRCLSATAAQLLRERHGAEIARRRRDAGGFLEATRPLLASVLLLAACQDTQKALDFHQGGAFTLQLERVCEGDLSGMVGYEDVVKRIARELGLPDQTPRFDRLGPRNSNFERQLPFQVE